MEDEPWQETCPKCGNTIDWIECANCEDGYSHHDCGEDTCCCLNPEPNVICDVCNGDGGWYTCFTCSKCFSIKDIKKSKEEIENEIVNQEKIF